MTPEQRIDAALDSVLKASGSALRHYTMPKTLADMREAMRKVMFDEYIRGLNDNLEAMCSDGWNYPRKGEPVDGECPDCGEPTCDGVAASGCNYSPCVCETCGACPCDGSC